MAEENENLEYGEFAEADVVKSTFIDGQTFYSKPVLYTEVDGLALFEGDIILGSAEEVEQNTEIRKEELTSGIAMGVVISGSQYRWPGCKIPYTIDAGLPNQLRVSDAIAHWEAKTRYRFILRTPANSGIYPDWINFKPSSGCSSYVGRQGGTQPINLAPGCTTGNTIHEIGHALGLWHEHSREDRDSRVTINWSKIVPGREHNFHQHITDGDDIGVYEYGSIMHYPRTAFSVDGSETITPIDPAAVIGQRSGLSPGDIMAANSLCPPVMVRCPPAPVRCPPAPVQMRCPPAPVQMRCPPAPVQMRCPPAPGQVRCPPAPVQMRCPPAPGQVRCPPSPIQRRCPPAPVQVRCPPSPIQLRCPPAPVRLRCPPAPVRLRCPPAAGPVGCQAGPYYRPGPRVPVVRPPRRMPQREYYDYDPEAYETSDYSYDDLYAYDCGAYDDPYMNESQEVDWTQYEYSDPYGESYYDDYTEYDQNDPYDPQCY